MISRNKNSKNTIIGTFKSRSRGGGVVIPENRDLPEIKISRMGCSTALHRDEVKVGVQRWSQSRTPQGLIIKILKRANTRIIGRIFHNGSRSEVIPLDSRIGRTIRMHRMADFPKVPQGAYVLVEILSWSASKSAPLKGKLVEVLGIDSDPRLPVQLFVRGAGVRPEFPAGVEVEAKRLLRNPPTLIRMQRRTDFRRNRVFTIDGATAKDFDDAVSLHQHESAGWRIGVHIADVAHYVGEGSVLDAEAHKRSTSIYPVDRVIPMLPETLSNDLCSLRPDEDKITMSVLFTVDREGNVGDITLCNSRIRSIRRFAYEEVQAVFNDKDAPAVHSVKMPAQKRPRPEIPRELRKDLLQLRQASRVLNSARMKRGAFDLELSEAEVLFDGAGQVSNLRRADRFESHRLIEELMIAANEAVAQELERRGFSTLFRVHEEPDEERLKAIAPALARLGISLPVQSITREDLQAALDKARGHQAGPVVQRWVLRSMKRARYQKKNIGHYGLASTGYVHFTSPIRRYPDLLVHRIVKALLGGAKSGDPRIKVYASKLDKWAEHTSEREKHAQKIEWNARDALALQFMKRYEGDVFEGFISGVSRMGFHVELVDYPVEGLVRVSKVDGYWDLDEKSSIWHARRSGATYSLGDSVKVRATRIDVLASQMDLTLVHKGPARATLERKALPSKQKKSRIKRRICRVC